jgi:hypothetical protein
MSNSAITEGCADFLIDTTWLINLSNHRHRSPLRLLKLPELRRTEVDGPAQGSRKGLKDRGNER